MADKIITATSVEAPPAWWPDFFPSSFHLDNLRQVLLHVIAETVCHAGHLDVARELIEARPGSSSPNTAAQPVGTGLVTRSAVSPALPGGLAGDAEP